MSPIHHSVHLIKLFRFSNLAGSIVSALLLLPSLLNLKNTQHATQRERDIETDKIQV